MATDVFDSRIGTNFAIDKNNLDFFVYQSPFKVQSNLQYAE